MSSVNISLCSASFQHSYHFWLRLPTTTIKWMCVCVWAMQFLTVEIFIVRFKLHKYWSKMTKVKKLLLFCLFLSLILRVWCVQVLAQFCNYVFTLSFWRPSPEYFPSVLHFFLVLCAAVTHLKAVFLGGFSDQTRLIIDLLLNSGIKDKRKAMVSLKRLRQLPTSVWKAAECKWILTEGGSETERDRLRWGELREATLNNWAERSRTLGDF